VFIQALAVLNSKTRLDQFNCDMECALSVQIRVKWRRSHMMRLLFQIRKEFMEPLWVPTNVFVQHLFVLENLEGGQGFDFIHIG